MFLPLEGIRTPYVLTLDKMRNLLSCEIDHVELERIKSNPFVLARHRIAETPEAKAAAHEQLLRTQGLHKHITDTGILISRDPVDEWGQQFESWLDSSAPNPFPDTDDLRAEYFDTIADVKARIAEGTCPGCELTKTQVTFRLRVRARLGLS